MNPSNSLNTPTVAAAPTLTFQHFVIGHFGVGQLSEAEHLPHQHAEGPHVGLGWEVVLKHRLLGQPAQRDPGLPVVVVLAATQDQEVSEEANYGCCLWKLSIVYHLSLAILVVYGKWVNLAIVGSNIDRFFFRSVSFACPVSFLLLSSSPLLS